MTTFTIPYDDEPLIKAVPFCKSMKQDLGSWRGLPIIALGKRNGKIVGYDSKNQPIYASSPKAKKLAAIKQQDAKDKVDSVGEWLLALGIPNQIKAGALFVQPKSAELLKDHFGVTGKKVGGAVKFSFGDLLPHTGEPLVPKEEEQTGWAATMASGEMEEDPFPDLSTLKELEDPGKFAGSGYHGVNRLFEDPSGQKFVFKDSHLLMARGGEAAARVGRLILGDKIPPVRMVEIGGKLGALIKVVPGEMMTETNHSNPPGKLLDKHRKDIARHFVVDWLISNHDAHGGNFLTHGDDLIGIDKGQAWKFFGKDPLDPNYSPNEHDTIYRKFWDAVEKGTIELDTILDAMGEALDAAETISPDQFKSIVAPYVSEAAGDKFDPEVRAAQMAARLENLRADMEGFLSKRMGKPVKIPKKHGDNFETMPEVESVSGPPLTIKVPDKPKVIEGGPKEPIQTEKAAGWPATKGQVTIHHPGEASPGGHWPKGFPGLGFKAGVKYKKQQYTVEFVAGPGGKLWVDVYYPDGSLESWPTPNAAYESMMLHHKGLPMTLSSTEKKAKGIGGSSKKAFGIQAFKHELAQAHAGALIPAEMNPKELEDAGIVEKGAPELTVEAVMAKMPDGVVEDWDELPHQVKEAMLANDFAIGKDYPAAIVPGWAYKTTEEGVPVLYFPKKPTTPGVMEYHVFEWENGKLTQDVMLAASVDAIYNLDTNAWFQSIKKDIIQDLPQTADEKIGAAPKAEIPKEAKVPADAPKEYDGPLPPGTSHTVKKKFPWGKGDVMLLAHLDGFDASFFDGEGNFQTQTFKSLSAACDWVWVNQKGYPDAAAYKAAKKTNKISSGGGWKFWGLNTKPKPKPSEKIPKTPDGKPGLESLDAFPSSGMIESYPVGTVIIWNEGGKVRKAKRFNNSFWELHGVADEMITVNHNQFKQFTIAGAENVKVKVPVEKAPEPPVATWGPEWEDVEYPPSALALDADPIGTSYVYSKAGSTYEVKKIGPSNWIMEGGTEVASNTLASGMAFASDIKLKGPETPVTGEPGEWQPVEKVKSAYLDSLPDGAQLKTEDGTIWQKVGSGASLWVNPKTKGSTSSMTMAFQLEGETAEVKGVGTVAPPVASKPAEENFETMPKMPTEAQLKGMAVGSVLIFSSATYDYSAEKLPNGQWRIEWEDDETTDSDWYLRQTMEAAEQALKEVGQTFEVEQKVLAVPEAPPGVPDVKDPLEGMPTTWSPAPPLTLDFIADQPEGTQFKVDNDAVWVKLGSGDAKWQNTKTGEKAFQGILFGAIKSKDVQLRTLDATKFMAQQKAAEAVAPVPESAWQDVTKAPTTDWISELAEGTKIQFWNEPLGDFITVRKNAEGEWVNTDDPDDWFYNMDLGSMLPDAIKFKGSFGFLEAGAVPAVPSAPESEAIKIPATPTDVDATIAVMKAGDELVWSEGEKSYKLHRKSDGTYMLIDWDDDTVIYPAMKTTETINAVSWSQNPKEFELYIAVTEPTPSEANWETMPDNLTAQEYVDHLATLPVGSQFKMTSKGTGKETTAVKTGDDSYTLVAWNGADFGKDADEFGQYLIYAKDISYKKAPIPITPDVVAKPAFAAIAGGTVDVPSNASDVQTVLEGMTPGQELTWNDDGTNYKATATTSGFSVISVDSGELFTIEASPDEIILNIEWDKGPTGFKLTTPGEPVTKKTKTVTVSIDEAIQTDMAEKWGGKFVRKSSNKKGHVNLIIKDKAGGKEALQEVVEKYGLTVTNKGGQPKLFYGTNWVITVPNHELGKQVETEIPADGPIPESVEPSAELSEEKEEAKWAAVGAIGGKASQLLDMGYQFKWPEEVLPDDNVVEAAGPMAGTAAAKIEAKGLKLVKGKKPKPKPELSPEQKAKIEKAKAVAEWLKTTPAAEENASIVLAHFQALFEFHKSGMKAWARSGGKGKLLLGSPNDEFANLMADFEKTQGLKTKKVDTPLGTFWEVKTKDLAKAIPGQPADTVKGPDGKTYPKGTTWQKEVIPYTAAQLLSGEEGFYKITDHKTDSNLKVVKVAGTGDEGKELLIDMLKKHGLTYEEPIKGGANWLTFVPTKELEKVAKEDIVHNAQVPPQPKPFISAPYPTMGSAKGGEPGVSSPADLANIQAIKIGMTGHSIRMGAAGILRNGQIYVRKVKDVNGKTHYDIHGELEARKFNVGKSALVPQMKLSLPSAMKGPTAHDFEDGVHIESSENLYDAQGYSGETAQGSRVQVFSGNDYPAFQNMFSVRIEEGADIESELAAAFESMGIDAGEAMREQTPDDERIMMKSAIVKNKIGAWAWRKKGDIPEFPPHKRFDEAWLDSKLKELGVSKQQVASARYVTTIANHQSVVIDDPKIANSEKVQFVYIGMGGTSMLNQIVDGSGWCARTHYVFNGQKYGLTSPKQDLESGGANSSFCRIGTSDHTYESWGLCCDGWKVVLHKRILNRTNWRFYMGDAYGTTDNQAYFHKRRHRDGVMGDDLDSSNEICFDAGIGVQDIAGIMAPSEDDKQSMIKRMNEKGITELNGIALNDLIQVATTNSRTEMAKKFVGLKEGVLP